MLNVRTYCLPLILILLFLSCETSEENEENKDTPYDKHITAISVINDFVWVGTQKNGLYRIQNELWDHYTFHDGLLSDTITSLVTDRNGYLWVGTNTGISILKNETWTNLTTNQGLFSNDIRCLACDLTNKIWIGTRNNRLVKYDGENFTVYHVNPDKSGPMEMGHIHTITHDHYGNLWVGSCISGLSKFDKTIWTDNINNLNVFVESSICSNDGDVWIGHITGAYKYSNDSWTHYTVADGLVGEIVRCFAIDQQNSIWIGTDAGLSKFDGSDWINYTTENGLISNKITALAFDPNADLWIGSSEGLMKLIVD